MRSFGSKQRNATGNNMCEISGKLVYFWEKVSVKKKTSCGQTKEKVIFFKKIQAKTIFLIKSKVKFLGCLRKNSWKTWFLCLKNASKKESWESLTKVWWKFHWNFRAIHVGSAAKMLHSHACFRTGVFSQGRLYTEKLLRRSAFRHRTFYTRCLHTQACTQRSFYTQRLSRMFLLTDAFTRSFYREAFTNRSPLLVRQTLLHIETVAHRSFCKPKPAFYAQKLLRREVLADRCCSHRRSQKLLHTDTFFTQKLLHGEIVTSCSFRRRTPLHYTQKLLHKRSFCAQMQLHADTFPHRGPVTQRSFDTGKLWHTEAFAARRLDTQKLLHMLRAALQTDARSSQRSF